MTVLPFPTQEPPAEPSCFTCLNHGVDRNGVGICWELNERIDNERSAAINCSSYDDEASRG